MQVLVIPFRWVGDAGWEFGVLRRCDPDGWQWVAGPAEGEESALDAALSQTRQKLGVLFPLPLFALDSEFMIPVASMSAEVRSHSSPEATVIPVRAFAARVESQPVQLSSEHSEIRWVGQAEAAALLESDADASALTELVERLARDDLRPA